MKLGWQPIKTAPRDEPLLVHEGGELSIAEFTGTDWYALSNGEHVCSCGVGADLLKPSKPSHWMYLPEVPK